MPGGAGAEDGAELQLKWISGVSSALKSPLRDEKDLQDVIQHVEEVALVEKKEEVTKKVEEMQGSCH